MLPRQTQVEQHLETLPIQIASDEHQFAFARACSPQIGRMQVEETVHRLNDIALILVGDIEDPLHTEYIVALSRE